MDFKKLLTFVLDPKILAAAGGYAGYRFVGKGKPGYQPYLYSAGGLAAGYLVGKVLSNYLNPPAAAPQVPPQQVQDRTPAPLNEYVDFEAAPLRQLPPPRAVVTPAPAPQVAAPAPSLEGTFEGSGEAGLGSFATDFDGDVDVEKELLDHGWAIDKN